MKFSATKPRAVLLAAVLVAVICALILLPNDRTYAQSETEAASARAIPALTAQATESGIVLRWEAAPGAVRYDLRTWWASDAGWQDIGGGNLTGTSYTHADVTAGTTYHYTIRAIYADGEGPWLSSDYPTAVPLAVTRSGTATPLATVTSAPASGPTSTATSTPTPTATATAPGLSIPALTARATAGGNVLSWEAVAGAVRYELLTYWAGDPGWQAIGGGALTGTSYTHAEVRAGTTYYYSIRALNAAGEASPWLSSDYPTAVALASRGDATPTPGSGPTATPTATAAGSGPTPTATASAELVTPRLTARATAGGNVLSWEAVAGAVRYELLTYWAGDPGWQAIGGGALTGTSHTHAAVTAGTTYFYSIRALNAAGEASPWLTGDYPTAVALASRGDATATVTAAGTPTPTATVATTERGALIALYEATNGGYWKRSDNWLSDAPLDDWYGVETDANGRVTGLRLNGNNLSGEIPDLSALSELQLIIFPVNRLRGEIPDLSALTNLRALFLKHNDLSGSLPDLSALTNLVNLRLDFNELSGEIPDLSALTSLAYLDLSHNELSGEIPDLSALAILAQLNLSYNRLSGSIPDLSALSSLEWISLAHNRLTGPFPALSASARMTQLNFSANELSGPFPDLSAFTELATLELNDNRLSGPVFDLDRHYELSRLYLHNNDLSGPLPDLSALPILTQLNLGGNSFCLPAGAGTSLVDDDADAHLKSLDLQLCAAADLTAFPAAPANLTATVAGSRVTLSWDAAADAASHELRVWDSLDRSWAAVGGVLTGTTYAHPVLTDGRNYYFQVRARDAGGVRGPWSDLAHAIIVPGRYPPPPASLGIHIFYQKYLEIDGVVITAPTEVSDETIARTAEIVAAMLSGRPAFFESLTPKYLRVALFKRNAAGEYKAQLPELGNSRDARGGAFTTATAWVAAVSEFDPRCRALIHEFAHAVHFALKDQPGTQGFDARLHALYNAALDAGLWKNSYAETFAWEYWAEAVTFWFKGRITVLPEVGPLKVEEYDPEIAKLIVEVFGEGAYVPDYCKR